jgi:peptidoglycan-associated lipoprotein
MKFSKKVTLVTVFGMVFGFTGCSQKAPHINGAGGSDGNLLPDTVSINENPYAGGNVNGDPDGLNFASNGVDGSADNFKSVFFGFDSFRIGNHMQDVITHNVNTANASSGKRVRIEGNCDEFGTDEYNYALGLKRAKAVKDALALQGVPSSQIMIVSYGESNPLCGSMSSACLAKNRRADLRLIQ